MRKRLAVVSAGILAGLMALGTANALVLDTTPGSESTASEQAVAGAETAYVVGDAGTVTITNDGTQLEIVSIEQSVGWNFDIEVATGREIEIDFRSGTRRIQFNAELEDGQIRFRARERVASISTSQSTTRSTPEPTTRSTTSTTAAGIASTSGIGTTTHQAGAAGTVTIANDGTQLTITAVDPADGWSHEIEVRVGREVEMDFRNGENRVQFNAELEDGQVRVRVRTRPADGPRTEVTNGVDTSLSDDNSSTDDNSMDDRSGDSDHDNSGRGDSDDDHDDDNNSGRRHSDDDSDDDDSNDDDSNDDDSNDDDSSDD